MKVDIKHTCGHIVGHYSDDEISNEAQQKLSEYLCSTCLYETNKSFIDDRFKGV